MSQLLSAVFCLFLSVFCFVYSQSETSCCCLCWLTNPPHKHNAKKKKHHDRQPTSQPTNQPTSMAFSSRLRCLTVMAVAASVGAGGESENFDVIVYDATSGGITAAVAAKRSGLARVGVLCASWPACFDEGGRIIGGMSTNGLGQSDIGGHDVFGGLAREFYHRNWLHYFPNGSSTTAGTATMQECRLPDGNKCNVTANIEPHVGVYRQWCAWYVYVHVPASCADTCARIATFCLFRQVNQCLRPCCPKQAWSWSSRWNFRT